MNWISVNDSLPNLTNINNNLVDQPVVLVIVDCYPFPITAIRTRQDNVQQELWYQVGYMHSTFENHLYDFIPTPTHWLPLPELPNENNIER